MQLQPFTLVGGEGKTRRHTIHQLENEGYTFEVMARDQVPGLLPELRAVSDEWLAAKKTREKSFSLGAFREDYLRRSPAAVVRKERRVIAFANLWLAADREELSVDLSGWPRFRVHPKAAFSRNQKMRASARMFCRKILKAWNHTGETPVPHGFQDAQSVGRLLFFTRPGLVGERPTAERPG